MADFKSFAAKCLSDYMRMRKLRPQCVQFENSSQGEAGRGCDTKVEVVARVGGKRLQNGFAATATSLSASTSSSSSEEHKSITPPVARVDPLESGMGRSVVTPSCSSESLP